MTAEIRLSASAHANVAFKEIQPNTAKFSFFHISLQQTKMERNHEKESEKIKSIVLYQESGHISLISLKTLHI